MRTRLVALALASLFLSALLSTACGKSVEGETKSWNANKLELEKLGAKYPGLKAPIAQHVAEAQKDFDAAQQLSDEDQKTAALSVANQRLMQVLTAAQKLDKTILEIEALKKDQRVLSLTAAEVNPAIQMADGGLEKVSHTLDGKNVDSSGALVGRIEEAIRVAEHGAAPLRALKAKVDGAAKAEADKAAADKAAADKAAADKAAPEAAKTVDPAPAPTTP